MGQADPTSSSFSRAWRRRLRNPAGLHAPAKAEYHGERCPDHAEKIMHDRFAPFAAPELRAVNEELAEEARGPEAGEGPAQPGARARALEKNLRLQQRRQSHDHDDHTDKERVHVEDRFIRG